MCGIAGIIQLHGTPEKNLLEQAVNQLQHRGPDDSGVYIDQTVGLTHTRLSIIDLEGGHQPIFSNGHRYALVANGEIYNYPELRATQIQSGCSFTTGSDSETITHAWAKKGLEGIRELHGMFAFALHDKDSNQLILGRDRLGIKPLFYAKFADRLVFASELKALLGLMPDAPEIQPEGLTQFLQNQFNTGRETIFKGIQRLLPGECMEISENLDIKHKTYWSPLDFEPLKVSFEEANEMFIPLFDQVMQEHIRSDVPYGLFLSGGIDSAIVLAMLSRLQDHPVRSYSIGFNSKNMKDELDDASAIAQHFNAQHQPIKLEPEQLLKRIPHMIWATDDLMRDYAALPTSLMSEIVARDIKVVFTGEGGDEVFAGYGRYRMSSLQRSLKALIASGTAGFRTRGQWHNKWYNTALKPELTAVAGNFRQPFISAWQACPADWSNVQKSQYTDLVTALPDNLLVKVDRNTMAFGLEARVPFLDHRLVEFGLSLPDALKISSGQGKLFLKRWAEQYLPKDHLYKKKRGFHVPAGDWFTGDFLTALEQKLLQNKAIQTWFNPPVIRELVARHHSGRKYTRELWCLMQFAIWHHLFIEHGNRKPTVEEDPLDWIS